MFSINVDPNTDSDSDEEVPKFDISAFHKYSSKKKDQTVVKSALSNRKIKLSSSLDPGDEDDKNSLGNIQNYVKKQKDCMKNILNEHLKKSIVCQPGFEKLAEVPTFKSDKVLKRIRKRERNKTKGFEWFDMRASEMTEEKKNDLLVVKLRQALDPKHFYKRSVNKTNSKYFEVGTFIDDPVDFYNSRIPKKQRKQTIVEELLADEEFRSYQKKKIAEYQEMLPPKFHRRQQGKKTKLREAKSSVSEKKHKKNRK